MSLGRQIAPSFGRVSTEEISATCGVLPLIGVAGLAHGGLCHLHRQFTDVAVTGFLHPLFPERFGGHPLPGELGEAFGLIGIQHKGLLVAIHLADHVALKIVQVRDLGVFFLSTRARSKARTPAARAATVGSFKKRNHHPLRMERDWLPVSWTRSLRLACVSSLA